MICFELGDGLFGDRCRVFNYKEELFCRVCEKLGGVKAGKGDVAYELPLFDFLSCRIQFWNSDEEFDAQLLVFWTKYFTEYL